MKKTKKMFIAFDGESMNTPNGVLYNLLQISNENVSYTLYTGSVRITTSAFLDFFLRIVNKVSAYEIIGFVISYDVENIFRDLTQEDKDLFFAGEEIELSYKNKKIKLFYLKRKLLSIAVGRKRIVIQDVFTFSLKSLVKTVYKFASEEELKFLETYKNKRGTFEYLDIQNIKKYNLLENVLLCRYAEKLRDDAKRVGLEPRLWIGSSAMASKFLESVKREVFFDERWLPTKGYDGLLRAYFGGRIEMLKIGTFTNVYEYDIRSAYPTATCCLHLIHTDNMYYVKNPTGIYDIGWYRVEFESISSVGCLPVRRKDESIFFPQSGSGWYMGIEVNAAIRARNKVQVFEGYYFDNTGHIFKERIEKVFSERKKLKEQGDSSEYILKICLNSLYGKFCQTVGKVEFRNLIYAAYITAYTRAKILDAIYKNEDSIIAIATDGIYSKKRLNLSLGDNLGEWEENKWESGRFVMSGIYKLENNGKTKTATRGYGSLDFERLWRDIATIGSHEIKQKIFVNWRLYRHLHKIHRDNYLQFVEVLKEVNPLENKVKRGLPSPINWEGENDTEIYAGQSEISYPSKSQMLISNKSDIESEGLDETLY